MISSRASVLANFITPPLLLSRRGGWKGWGLKTNIMNTKQNACNKAREYYFQGIYAQKEIAQMTEVSERTIYNWIKEGSWEQLRTDALLAPSHMMHHFINQLLDLQNTIAAREAGNRHPDPKEMETQRKLLKTILDLKKYPTELIGAYASHTTPLSDIADDAQTDNPPLALPSENRKFEILEEPETQKLKLSQNSDYEQLAEFCAHPSAEKPSAKTGTSLLNANENNKPLKTFNTNKKIFGKLMHSGQPALRGKTVNLEKHKAPFL
jgi:hypothetical protein